MPGNYYNASKFLTAPGADALVFTARAIASRLGWVVEFGGGGEATTSTKMRTVASRASTVGITPVDLTEQKGNPLTVAATLFCSTSFGTDPVITAGDEGLWQSGWNAHGGIFRWLAAPDQGWGFFGTAASESEISWENRLASGGDATYWMMWGE